MALISATDGELPRTECRRHLALISGYWAAWRRYKTDGSRLRKTAITVLAISAYFCLADAFLIGRCLCYKWQKPGSDEHWGSASASDDANQSFLYRKESNKGLPGSRSQSSASQAKRSFDLASAALPAIKEDERNSKKEGFGTSSAFCQCLLSGP